MLIVPDRFRWVYCQLDTLRRCMPSSLRKALNELPTTLDDTYERALEGIPKEKRQYAHRLFQCLVAAIRPLRVEELAEIFAIDFDPNSEPNLLEGWRPDNPKEAVLSTCSTLITIIEDHGSKIVQFSHFSVKEYLTSDRLQASELGDIRQYHVPLDAAHTVLARACLTVLLQLDENVDKKCLARFPLVFYAAEHWVNHVNFENVVLRSQGIMECLFNPKMPYLAAWVWVHDVDVDRPRARSAIDDLPEHPPPPEGTALYYAASCGFSVLADHLIVTHAEDVNAECGERGSPLHAASYWGRLEVARLLLENGANVNLEDDNGKTPLVAAYRRNRTNLEAMRLLLKHGAAADVQYDRHGSILHDASYNGHLAVMELLLQHDADVNAGDGDNWKPLLWASIGKHADAVQLLLERGADINAQSSSGSTPLIHASRNGYLDVVRVLLEHGADVHGGGSNNRTPFQLATSYGRTEVAKLLLEYGAEEERTA
jgi:ankyrin repeat protein